MKRNKKFALVALLLLAVCAVTPLLSACNETGGTLTGGGADTLVIYNWEDYIDVALLDEFEAYYREVTGRNLSITYSTFDTNETMLTQVMRGETAVDVVCPSEYAIERLMRADLLADQTELVAEFSEQYPDAFSNLGNVNKTVLEKIGETFGEMEIGGEVRDMRDYMVPYMWGTLGLLYNTRVISEEELEEYGWGMLWNESDNPELEKEAFERAVRTVLKELDSVKTDDKTGHDIMLVHKSMVEDPEFRSLVLENIEKKKYNAAWAVEAAAEKFIALLEASGSEYFRERADDLRYVERYLLTALSGMVSPVS